MKNVYILRAGEDKYKIGVAENVRKRMSTIQTGCPWPVSLVTTKLVENAEQVERSLHAIYTERSSGGGTEWFTLTPAEALEACIRLHSTREPETLQWDVAFSQTMAASSQTLSLVSDMIRKVERLIPVGTEQQRDAPGKLDDNAIAIALSIFRRRGRVSTSLLQREMNIGYSRAARIVDELEKQGVVSQLTGNSPRRLLSSSPEVPSTS
jgi:DNA segregation ATPase FtsK/SpoIIIE-like protein